ncbi:FAD-dependent oxidoreductase [Umezawaea endophytica]|uniref:FAD-dependent monooxygenase n=1 Tax=Umezawaea endophytica TaxID=1654476 RepID=A0A9X2VL58_9PSEU|nr:FAD-dependent oxidoreductase [Umezawaea endophytica]MCS7478595.1 FAD-dependent monooxygenase [Umezawaea endophytica]
MSGETAPVLVVGGGLVGLSAALFLAARGVRPLLVERRPASSPHPRAIGYTARTVELLRSVGLESAIPTGGASTAVRRARVESLAGTWFEEQPWSPPSAAPEVEHSPCGPAGIAQDRLEPLLRDRAVALGADVRLSTELVSFEQDDAGVSAVLRAADGGEYEVRAEHLVAADGHRSPVREALGVHRTGRGHLATVRSVLFRAPLEEYLRGGVGQFAIDQPGLSAFLTTYGDGRWVLMFEDDVDRDEKTLRDLVARAIGRSDVAVELITTGRWELAAAVADTYSVGRAHLAGDAAHTLPPNRGGYGANVGIEDAHNLAWKLAAVLAGESTPGLLDTYDAERRPVAELCHRQLFARPERYNPEPTRDVPLIDDRAMVFGQLYRSAAVLDAGPDLPPALRPEQWAGQPGTRAPHLWLSRDGARPSTLDLFGRGWVLLSDNDDWADAAKAASPALDHRRVDVDGFRTAFGLHDGGATLVRPDGYIAWRSPDLPADPANALTSALRQVSFATARPSVSLPGR